MWFWNEEKKDDSARLLNLLQRVKTLLQEREKPKKTLLQEDMQERIENELNFLRTVRCIVTKYVFLDGLIGRLMRDKQYRKIFFK